MSFICSNTVRLTEGACARFRLTRLVGDSAGLRAVYGEVMATLNEEGRLKMLAAIRRLGGTLTAGEYEALRQRGILDGE